jgi:L-alanine-DL-glutamate epimerase-like enolase superfamily enzyme
MKLQVHIDQWPVKKPFKIAYHTFFHRDLLRVELTEGGLVGRGEAGGHPQLEAIDSARERILELQPEIESGLSRERLMQLMPRGPARNALDSALWDLETKRTGQRVWTLAGLPETRAIQTAYTIGIGPVEEMVAEARRMSEYSLLKLKVDGESGFDLLQSVAEARPDASFIIDANEAWRMEQLESFATAAQKLRVQLIEQPLPHGEDEVLEDFVSPIPLAADESFHGLPDVERLKNRYQVINIKLDKIGGLTEALLAAEQARKLGIELMVGCNGGTSLGIAPAYCLALLCRYVDLDSPLLLAHDRDPGLVYRAGCVLPPPAELWG